MALADILKKPVNYVADVISQTLVLLAKNLILLFRRWKSTCVMLGTPVIIVFILFILGIIIESNYDTYTQVGASELGTTRATLQKCISLDKDSPCKTLAYTTNNNVFAQRVIDHAISTVGLTSEDTIALSNTEELRNYLFYNPNKTLTAVAFDGTIEPSLLYPTLNLSTVHYTLFFNSSENTKSNSGIGNTAQGVVNEISAWQVILDNSIIYLRAKDKGLRSHLNNEPFFAAVPNNTVQNVFTKGYPKIPSKPNGQLAMMSLTGSQFFSLTTMIIFVICMYDITMEKEQRLRFGMVMMGLKNISYWSSYVITFAAILVLQVLITISAGAAFQLFIFLYTNFFAMLFAFLSYGFCLVCLAILLSNLLTSSKTALVLGFIIIAASYIVNLIFANVLLVQIIFMEGIPKWIPIVASIYPPFHFAKIFADFLTKTQPIFNPETRQYDYTNHYNFDDLFKYTGLDNRVIPSYISMLILIGEGLVFLILHWYLDNVINNSNVGFPGNLFFFLYPSYWGIHLNCFSGSANSNSTSENKKTFADHERTLINVDSDIKQEYERAMDTSVAAAIRIQALKKTYGNPILGLCWKNVNALQGLDLVIEQGQCFTLLGHNGCGKTTTISILQGLISASSGRVTVYGQDIRYHIDDVRKRLGVCPQHDILWNDLTAREHLLLFSILKGVSLKNMWEDVNQKLRDVDLLNVANHVAGSFSGGMKRRLSVSVACIANPQVILLDEPTTGLDPLSKRQVWKLIEGMKKNRVVLLTTHSMEEADALSDRIGIMAYGRLKCIGDSIHLKTKFGSGYNLHLTVAVEKEQAVHSQVVSVVPQVKKISSNAGNIIYGIPQENLQPLIELLKQIERDEKQQDEGSEENKTIKEWSISHSTLEEVYLRVTSSSDFGYASLSKQQQSAYGTV